MKEITADSDGSTAANELKVLREITHQPYIVKFEESFQRDGKIFIIMEYCEKGDLRSYLSRQAGCDIPERRIWRIFFQIAQALE